MVQHPAITPHGHHSGNGSSGSPAVTNYTLAQDAATVALLEALLVALLATGQEANAKNQILAGQAMSQAMLTQYQNLLSQIQQQEQQQAQQTNVGWGIFAGSLALDVIMCVIAVVTLQPELLVITVVMAAMTTTIPGHQSLMGMATGAIASDLQADGLSPTAAKALADTIMIVVMIVASIMMGNPEGIVDTGEGIGASAAEDSVGAAEDGVSATEDGASAAEDTTQNIAQKVGKFIMKAIRKIFGGVAGRATLVGSQTALATNFAQDLVVAIMTATGKKNKKLEEILTIIITVVEVILAILGGLGMSAGGAGAAGGKAGEDAASGASKLKQLYNALKSLLGQLVEQVTGKTGVTAASVLKASQGAMAIAQVVEIILSVVNDVIGLHLAQGKSKIVSVNAEIALLHNLLSQSGQQTQELGQTLSRLIHGEMTSEGKVMSHWFDGQKAVANFSLNFHV